MKCSLSWLVFFFFPVYPHLVFFQRLFCGWVGGILKPFDNDPLKTPHDLWARKQPLLKLLHLARQMMMLLLMMTCVHVWPWQACAPLWSQECGTSMFSTGICASVSDELEPRETIAPTAQSNRTHSEMCQSNMWLRPDLSNQIFSKPPVHVTGCSTYMDIVIVLDGSNSIYPWYEVQNFLSNILSKFHISSDQMQVQVDEYPHFL